MMHSHKTHFSDRTDHSEPNDKACVSRRTNSDQNMCKWISHVPQVSRHCRIRRRIHEQIVDKKFVATNVSVRLLGIKRRSEGMAMSSHEETSSWNDQEDGMMKGKRRRQAETQAR